MDPVRVEYIASLHVKFDSKGCLLSFSINILAHCPNTCSRVIDRTVEPTHVLPREGRHGVPSPPSSPSPPRHEAMSRNEPTTIALVHAPSASKLAPQALVPELVFSPKAMQAFKAYLDSLGLQPTHRKYRDFLGYWSLFGGHTQP